MKRWAVMLGCVLGLLGGCSSDDSPGDGNGGTVAGSGAGSGGAGGSGTGGSGGAGGSSTAGTGSGGAGGAGAGAGAGGAGSGGTSAGSGGPGGSGGESGASGASGSSADACGSRGLPECPAGSFCNYPREADCGRGDAPGVCTVLTDVFCSEEWDPVCGCDGVTRSNACTATQAQVSIDHDGECEPPEAGYDCVLNNVACLIALPVCEEGQVPTANGTCIGPCVPIEQCACQGPEDCPSPETYTCHLSAGHCGPYVN